MEHLRETHQREIMRYTLSVEQELKVIFPQFFYFFLNVGRKHLCIPIIPKPIPIKCAP
jgi:hypothetical protein